MKKPAQKNSRRSKKLLKVDDVYQGLFHDAKDAIFVAKDGLYVDCNRTAEAMFGISRDELIGKTPFDISPEHQPDGRNSELAGAEMKQKVLDGECDYFEWVYKRKNGTPFYTEVNLIKIAVGNDTGILSIVRDISERKHTAQIHQALFNVSESTSVSSDLRDLLATIRRQLGTLIDTTNYYVSLYDPDSDTYLIPYEVDEEETWDNDTQYALQNSLTDYVRTTGKSLFADEETFNRLCAEGKVKLVGAPSSIWMGAPLKTSSGIIGVVALQSYTRDDLYTKKDLELLEFIADHSAIAIERKRAEDERKKAVLDLADEKERLVVTLKSIGDAVISTDTKGKIITMNPVAEELTGWPLGEAIGKNLNEIYHRYDAESNAKLESLVQDVLLNWTKTGLSHEVKLISRNDSKRYVSESIAPIKDKDSNLFGVVIVFRDVTEKRDLNEELIKAQKLESLGILAGGIAHDFNNILSAIVGNISIARMRLDSKAVVLDKLDEAEKSAHRAKALTHKLLTFSKGGTPVRKLTSLKNLVEEAVDIAIKGGNIKCDYTIQDDLWNAEVDDSQISQVFYNLLLNAHQAMIDGGVVHLSVENVDIQPGSAIPLEAGKYICINISDQGIGIPDNLKNKIFDPFFTTKQQGTGLGLASSFSIIKNHKGCIIVDSTPEKGSTFCVYLPAADVQETGGQSDQSNAEESKKRILVMDDEEPLLLVLDEMLSLLGYDVKCVENGSKAIKEYKEAKENGTPFDLVIMDLIIPGDLGGKETIKILLEYDPDVKAIVSSGYSNDPSMADYQAHGFAGMVPKPYRVAELQQAIEDIVQSKTIKV
ncbi:MAG: PAS domain S-box protein [Candidatus Electryonea clarkiae]|nr:PAS domain S-box protein [Candidatus Electryonea clarkiae]